MGRHGRSSGVRRARATVVKAAAAVGVATAIAVGVNSVANSPVGAHATTDANGEPMKNLSVGSVSDSGQPPATQSQSPSPSTVATQMATAPREIQQDSARASTRRRRRSPTPPPR
jgi:hypothetical protein